MNSKALICNEKQEFTIEHVTLKDTASDQVAVRTLYTGVSIGTEFAFIRNKLSPGPYPRCTGYMGTGVVEAVGSDIDNFKAGDKVYFRGNDTMAFVDGGPISCVSGAHCSDIVTRPNTTHDVDHMLPDVAMDVACMYVMPAAGLYGVDMANPRMGETVVVYGSGLIGLGVVAACAHRGCVVVATDINDRPLAIAKTMGADFAFNGGSSDVDEEVKRIAPDGAERTRRSGDETVAQGAQMEPEPVEESDGHKGPQRRRVRTCPYCTWSQYDRCDRKILCRGRRRQG